MRFGIFLAPFHALNGNPTNALDRDFELIEHLDRLGYDEAWIGEHHSGGFEIIASPEIFMAAAFERTKNIRIGTGVVSLPYHHPFMAVDRMIQLDHQSKGRAMFGVGPGALVGDAFRMGIDPATQRDRMNEALDVILPLLRGEIVSTKADWFEVREAQIQLPCYTQPHIEMAVACARSPSGALAAGKHGLGMLSIGGTSDDALAHIAETREQALENVKFDIELFARYFREIATFLIVPDNILNAAEYLVDNKMACIGTPDDAIEYIEKLQKGTGGSGAYMELAHNWADWRVTKRHYELMSRYVAPHFQGLNGLRQASYNYSFENRDVFVGKAAAAVQEAIDTHEKASSKKNIAAE